MHILGEGVDVFDKEQLLSEVRQLDSGRVVDVPLKEIEFGFFQPRKTTISTESISELASSINQQGILQPIIIRKVNNKKYQLIAGERRCRAAELIGLQTVPAIIKQVNEKDAFALAIVENIQRKQLSLLEEAEALKRLKEEFLFTNDETAQSIGRPRTTVTNLLRLSEKLCVKGKEMLSTGLIDYGHARALLGLPSESQTGYLDELATKKVSVRLLETKIRQGKKILEKSKTTKKPGHSMQAVWQEAIANKLGLETKVDIDITAKGTITFNISGEQEMAQFLSKLDSIYISK